MKKSVYLSSLLASCLMILSVAAYATPPVISVNPTNTTVCTGSTAKFYVTAGDTTTGATPLVYRWQVSTDGSTWSDITDTPPYSNSSTDTLSVSAAMALSGYWYRAIDSNNDGMDTSLAARLMVDTAYAGTITGPGAVCSGSTVTLTDAVTGGVWTHLNHITDSLHPASGVLIAYTFGFDTVTYVVTNTCGASTATLPVRIDTVAPFMPIEGPTSTCIGHTIDLTDANTLGTGTWSLGGTTVATISATGALTGLSGGLETVTYTFTNGCGTITATMNVTVDAPLAVFPITGPDTVCAGSWIHLFVGVGPGVWLSSSPAAVVDGSGNVTGVSSGTAVISYIRSNACGSVISTDTITVLGAAGPIVGIDSVGTSASRLLTDAVPGGTWSVSPTSVATIGADGTIHGVSPGTAVVTYSLTTACGSSTSTLVMHVGFPPPAGLIFGPDTVCIGHTITLHDTAYVGGVWSSITDTIASVDPSSGLVTGIAQGFCIVTYTAHNAFGTNFTTHTVWVVPTPHIRLFANDTVSLGVSVPITIYPSGGTFTVSNSFLGTIPATTLGSDSSGGFVVGYYIPAHVGTNTVTYSVITSCGTTDTSFHITVLPPIRVGQTSGTASTLSVYPNPNTGAFVLNLISGKSENANVVITNVVGEKVKEEVITTNQATEISLDQPAGVYFISVNTAEGKYTAKVTIAN